MEVEPTLRPQTIARRRKRVEALIHHIGDIPVKSVTGELITGFILDKLKPAPQALRVTDRGCTRNNRPSRRW